MASWRMNELRSLFAMATRDGQSNFSDEVSQRNVLPAPFPKPARFVERRLRFTDLFHDERRPFSSVEFVGTRRAKVGG